MCKTENGSGSCPETLHTHFMQPGHPFTLGEQQPDPRAEANAQAPVEEEPAVNILKAFEKREVVRPTRPQRACAGENHAAGAHEQHFSSCNLNGIAQ